MKPLQSMEETSSASCYEYFASVTALRYQPSTISLNPSAISYQPPATSHQQRAVSCSGMHMEGVCAARRSLSRQIQRRSRGTKATRGAVWCGEHQMSSEVSSMV